MLSQAEVGEGHMQVPRLAKWLQQIRLFRLAAQDLSESLWQVGEEGKYLRFNDLAQARCKGMTCDSGCY